MDVVGIIETIGESEQVTERFRKRTFVADVTDNPRWPQPCQFQVSGDRCEILDTFRVGEEVRIEFSLRGRAWTSPDGDVRHFNTLDVWNVVLLKGFGADQEIASKEGELPTDRMAAADDVPF